MKFVQSSSTTENVVRELRKELQHQANCWSKVLASNVLISTTLRNETTYLRKPKKWKQYLRLIMVHWYLPKEDGSFAVTHVELEQIENKFGADKSIAAHVMLSSEPEMILYILESSLFSSERHLFGFIKEPFRFSEYRFKIYRPPKAKRLVRRRGYKDHGSRRLPHEQHEAKFDYSFTEQQNQIEQDRQILSETKDLTQGMID